MQTHNNAALAPLTSFGVGGPAETLITIDSVSEVSAALKDATGDDLWLLGHGTNVLISDHGLPGTTLRFADGDVMVQDDLIVAGAGAAWDSMVKAAIDHGLWGIELTSGVPGSVGAAVFINITAYGQAQSTHLEWIEALNSKTGIIERFQAKQMHWDYKESYFQHNPDLIILRAAYRLSETQTDELTYQWALDVAKELNLEPDSLEHRRQIILETRKRAGSIFEHGKDYPKTVGSFFRNPMATPEQAEQIIEFDESNRTRDQIKKMNEVHGGNSFRVSAAHVMLAAGFQRGQVWGPVRLHPDHILKIENTGDATAQQIYDVAQEIITTTHDKLGITLEPEARILGKFA